MEGTDVGPVLQQLIDATVARHPRMDVSEPQLYLDHGELRLALGELLGLLVEQRVPVLAHEHEQLTELVLYFRALRPTSDPLDDSLAALDRIGRPQARRRPPPLRGGHIAAHGRPGATEFPPGWSADDVRQAADAVPAAGVLLANGHRWSSGVADAVTVVVVRDEEGRTRVTAPLRGPDVERASGCHSGTEELLARIVHRNVQNLLTDLGPSMGRAEREALRSLATTGEWEELADALVAHVTTLPLPLPVRITAQVRALLLVFDEQVDGCTYLNDRDAILARLEQR